MQKKEGFKLQKEFGCQELKKGAYLSLIWKGQIVENEESKEW